MGRSVRVRRSGRRPSSWGRAIQPRRRGFTLAELLIVLAIIAVLAAILVPSFSAARERARLAACAMQMRGIGAGIRHLAVSNGNRVPEFAFSDPFGNLPLSGHWGGMSQPGDPDCFGRQGVETVNLWRLVAEKIVSSAQLLCPASACTEGSGSYFRYTTKFSTYCLRFPYSEDLFRLAPELMYRQGRGLLGVYAEAGSGFQFHVGKELVTVPYARIDWSYRETDPRGGEQRRFEPNTGAIVADGFWFQDRCLPAAAASNPKVYEVRAGWCHRISFNVLFGDGAVHAIRDDGTVAANSLGPGQDRSPDTTHFASEALRVWRYFEDRR